MSKKDTSAWTKSTNFRNLCGRATVACSGTRHSGQAAPTIFLHSNSQHQPWPKSLPTHLARHYLPYPTQFAVGSHPFTSSLVDRFAWRKFYLPSTCFSLRK